MNVTFLLMPVDKSRENLDRLLNTIGDLGRYIKLGENPIINIKVDTEWKMFLYLDEYLSEELKVAFPYYLKYGGAYDFCSFYQRNILSPVTFTLSPRLFRAEIELLLDSVFPKKTEGLKHTSLLDGFIWRD